MSVHDVCTNHSSCEQHSQPSGIDYLHTDWGKDIPDDDDYNMNSGEWSDELKYLRKGRKAEHRDGPQTHTDIL